MIGQLKPTGEGRPQCQGTNAGALRLARSPLVSLAARRVSTSRRLGYEHPERRFGKATPTRNSPGWLSFWQCSRAAVVHRLVQASVPIKCCLVL